jgi:hypothetical protein
LYKSYQHNSVQDYCMAPHPIRRYVFNTIQIYLAIGHFPIRLYNRYIYIFIHFTLYYVCIVLYLCIYNFTHIPHIRQPPKPEIEFTYHQFFHKLLFIYICILYMLFIGPPHFEICAQPGYWTASPRNRWRCADATAWDMDVDRVDQHGSICGAFNGGTPSHHPC